MVVGSDVSYRPQCIGQALNLHLVFRCLIWTLRNSRVGSKFGIGGVGCGFLFLTCKGL